MSNTLIYNKLNIFLRKYYINELLKGTLLFISIGLLYFFVIVFFEYFLWLNSYGRTILFLLFISIELFLFIKFIIIPIFYLFKIKKGLDFKQASILIGNHFTSINDKLSNFLQLSDSKSNSDLLIAAINQKEKELSPIPFNNAINYKKSYKIIPFTLFSVFILLFIIFSGRSSLINSPFQRILSYNQEFKKPAPFTFKILNSSLSNFYNQDYTLKVKIIGNIIPENISIFYNNQTYLLKSTDNNTIFEHTFLQPKNDVNFQISSQNVFSDNYLLKIQNVPLVNNLKLILNYPKYLNKNSETINGSGNVIVPEGTVINFHLKTLYTTKVSFETENKISNFSKKNNLFTHSILVKKSFDYQIATSNKIVNNYEKFNFSITTISDQFPIINVDNAPDSLNISKNYLIGNISDDYGFTKLQIVYYPKNQPKVIKKANLKIKNSNQDTFVYQFPTLLDLQPGLDYDYYFEVFDNDYTNHFKSSKSQVFSNKILTIDEAKQENFNAQQSNLNQLSKTVKVQNNQIKEFDKIQKLNKEKQNFDFKDKTKINDLIKNQINQEKIIEDFSKKLKENLQHNKENFDKDLEKKIENSIEESEKNQKLLEELKELQDKLSKEELLDKLDKIKNNSKSNNKNLEQLLELTKRFYVEQKQKQLVQKLEKLADKQDKLSDNETNSKEKQDLLNKEFNQLSEELKELKKDNEELKKPLEMKESSKESNEIKEEQKTASDNLEKQKKETAKKNQKQASKKMKALATQMKSEMETDSKEKMEEDAAMLRQILDNLLSFSFGQENVLNNFKNQKSGNQNYSKFLKKQQDLKAQFKHIDDSLFALASRNKMIFEKVNHEIAETYYNIDKSLNFLSDYKVPNGTVHQQYVMNASNKLADMLSETLNMMQMQMNASGKGSGMPQPGSGGGGQLPDIIEKQKSLSKKVKDKLDNKGDQGQEGEEGKEGKEGKKGDEGKKGEDGKKGENGKSGENGSKGENGKSGSNGNKGKPNSSSNGEENAKELFEILQEQKKLRNQLQDMFSKTGLDTKQKKLFEDMKSLEKDILNKGFKNEIFNKMLNIQNQMLKLENATNLQEEDDKRESNTNKNMFNNNSKLPDALLKYLQSNEILQKNNLPFNTFYNNKSNIYFNTND